MEDGDKRKTRSIRPPSSKAYDFTPLLSFVVGAVKSNDPVVLEKAKHIDAREVFGELTKLEQAVAETYLHDVTDKQLFEYRKTLSLLCRLNDLQVTQEEYTALLDHRPETRDQRLSLRGAERRSNLVVDTQGIAEFIHKQTGKPLVLSRQWERNVQDAIRFYEIAAARDNSIAKCMDEFLAAGLAPRTSGLGKTGSVKRETKTSPESLVPSDDTRTAVLVYGGFHKENIKRILEAKGISYIVVSPRITKPSPRHEQFYKRLMIVGAFPFERALAPVLATATRNLTLYNSMPAPFGRAEVRAVADALRVNPKTDLGTLDRQLNMPVNTPDGAQNRSEARSKDAAMKKKASGRATMNKVGTRDILGARIWRRVIEKPSIEQIEEILPRKNFPDTYEDITGKGSYSVADMIETIKIDQVDGREIKVIFVKKYGAWWMPSTIGLAVPGEDAIIIDRGQCAKRTREIVMKKPPSRDKSGIGKILFALEQKEFSGKTEHEAGDVFEAWVVEHEFEHKTRDIQNTAGMYDEGVSHMAGAEVAPFFTLSVILADAYGGDMDPGSAGMDVFRAIGDRLGVPLDTYSYSGFLSWWNGVKGKFWKKINREVISEIASHIKSSTQRPFSRNPRRSEMRGEKSADRPEAIAHSQSPARATAGEDQAQGLKWDWKEVLLDQVDGAFGEWVRSGGIHPEDLMILKKVLSGNPSVLQKLKMRYFKKVSVNKSDDVDDGRTVYLKLNQPFTSPDGEKIWILRIKGARPDSRGKLESHVGSGAIFSDIVVDDNGEPQFEDLGVDEVQWRDEKDAEPQGAMLKTGVDREYRLMREGGQGHGFETDYPVATGLWKGRMHVGRPVGFVVAGMRSEDMRFRAFMTWDSVLVNMVHGEDLETDSKTNIQIFKKVGEALRAYHDRGHFHRYLHPGNVGIEIGQGGAIRVRLRDLDATVTRDEVTDPHLERKLTTYRFLDLWWFIRDLVNHDFIEAFCAGYFHDINSDPEIFQKLVDGLTSAEFRQFKSFVKDKRASGKRIGLGPESTGYRALWQVLYDLVTKPARAMAERSDHSQQSMDGRPVSKDGKLRSESRGLKSEKVRSEMRANGERADEKSAGPNEELRIRRSIAAPAKKMVTILQGEYTVAAYGEQGVRYLQTYGLGPCIAVIFWDAKSHTGSIMHIDDISDVQDALEEIKEKLTQRNVDLTGVSAFLLEGRKSEGSDSLLRDVRDTLDEVFEPEIQINLVHRDDRVESLGIDLETGEIFKVANPDRFQLSERVKQEVLERRSVGAEDIFEGGQSPVKPMHYVEPVNDASRGLFPGSSGAVKRLVEVGRAHLSEKLISTDVIGFNQLAAAVDFHTDLDYTASIRLRSDMEEPWSFNSFRISDGKAYEFSLRKYPLTDREMRDFLAFVHSKISQGEIKPLGMESFVNTIMREATAATRSAKKEKSSTRSEMRDEAMKGIPDSVISLARQVESVEQVEELFKEIGYLRAYGAKISGELLSVLETMAFIFGFESGPGLTLVESEGSIVKNAQVSSADQEEVWRQMYSPDNYGRKFEDIGDVDDAVSLALAGLSRDGVVVYSRIKQYKSLLEKLRGAIAKIKGVPVESVGKDAREIFDTVEQLKDRFGENPVEYLDDLVGFDIGIDDARMDEHRRAVALTSMTAEVHHLLSQHPGWKVVTVRKDGRAKGYESVNIWVMGLLDHKKLGSLPVKIQIRFFNALKHELVMRHVFKTTGQWEYPSWITHEEVDATRTIQELREVMFRNFRAYTKNRNLSGEFNILAQITWLPTMPQIFAYDWMNRLAVATADGAKESPKEKEVPGAISGSEGPRSEARVTTASNKTRSDALAPVTPSLKLKEPAVLVIEKERIEGMSLSELRQFMGFAVINKEKLWFVVPDMLEGKESQFLADLRALGVRISLDLPGIARDSKARVIGFSDKERDTADAFRHRLGQRLAEGVTEYFALENGEGLFLALLVARPEDLAVMNGFRYDKTGRYRAELRAFLQNLTASYFVISKAA